MNIALLGTISKQMELYQEVVINIYNWWPVVRVYRPVNVVFTGDERRATATFVLVFVLLCDGYEFLF